MTFSAMKWRNDGQLKGVICSLNSIRTQNVPSTEINIFAYMESKKKWKTCLVLLNLMPFDITPDQANKPCHFQ